MPYKSTLTLEEKDQLLKWASEGISYTEISRRLNGKISKQRVYQIAQRNNIDSTEIRKVNREKERNEKMFDNWGDRWNDKEWRKSAVYEAMREKFRYKKRAATYSKHEWDVSFGDLTFPTHCPILGIELDYFADSRLDNSPSFDRLNNNKGYVTGNVFIVSWRANRIKNDGSSEEHQLIADFMKKAGV